MNTNEDSTALAESIPHMNFMVFHFVKLLGMA